MHRGVFSYYDLFSASLAQRYLEKLDCIVDHWEIHFLRCGYSFLARGISEGAISAWNYLELPPDRRHAFTGPVAVRPLTDREADDIRRGLERIIAAAEDDEAVFAAPLAMFTSAATTQIIRCG
jgi:hypothetical protein